MENRIRERVMFYDKKTKVYKKIKKDFFLEMVSEILLKKFSFDDQRFQISSPLVL